MKRRFLSALLCLILVFSFALTVYATEQSRVIDEAELLTDSEEDRLEEKISSLWGSCELDVVILTVDTTLGESVQTYADDYYDEHGYGCGSDFSGILLLVCMDTREWYISTCGEAIYIFTDYGLDQMGQDMLPYLSEGNYYDGFDNWLDQIPKYCDAFSRGNIIDGYVKPDEYYSEYGDETVYYESEPNPAMNLLIAVAIGLMVATAAIVIMRSKMNTARAQSNAVNYVESGSYHLNIHRDMFLYRSMTKTPKPQNNGDGGGSSVHRSSGGGSHGGRGGRF